MNLLLSFLDILDRWELAIFNRYSRGSYTPVSAFAGKMIFWATCIFLVAAVVLNLIIYNWFATGIAAGVIFGSVLIILTWKVCKNIPAFFSVRAKISYAVYIYVLYSVLTSLMVFAVIIALALWVVWLFISGDWSKGKSGSGGSSNGGRTRGDAQHCPHCNYPWCDFIVGGCSECSLISGRRCKHGQW
ncbi:MAG: hypothetical protein LBK97_06490 [Prevotellaceae bacterium]|jgi:hypothetical protein|nr:hypothetical protein [Prevotellaceae bacterium]